jgi:hypothetical protein
MVELFATNVHPSRHCHVEDRGQKLGKLQLTVIINDCEFVILYGWQDTSQLYDRMASNHFVVQ